MASFMGMDVSFRPKEWLTSTGQALLNTGRGFVEMFSNKRLWVGLLVSGLLHLVIFLFYIVDIGGKAVGADDTEPIETEFDETMPPKVAKILREQQLGAGASTQEGREIDLTQGKAVFQSKVKIEEFSLDQGQASFTGDMLHVNPNARISTDEILSSAPIELKRGTGGLPSQSAFDRIAAGAGSPIELDSKSMAVGSDVGVKPKFQTGNEATAEDASKAAGTRKKSGFTLTGELSRGDIVSGPFPVYPGWARQKGLSNVTIRIRFTVDAAGNVSPTMIVQKSTGYPNWDADVKRTLGRWKFKPAASGSGKRMGIITFIFVLT